MFKLPDATKDSHRQYSALLGHCRQKTYTTLRKKIEKGQDVIAPSQVLMVSL